VGEQVVAPLECAARTAGEGTAANASADGGDPSSAAAAAAAGEESEAGGAAPPSGGGEVIRRIEGAALGVEAVGLDLNEASDAQARAASDREVERRTSAGPRLASASPPRVRLRAAPARARLRRWTRSWRRCTRRDTGCSS
jgi:hypothetical protein